MKYSIVLFLFTLQSLFGLQCKAFQFVKAETLLKESGIKYKEIQIDFGGKTLPFWMMETIKKEVSHFSPYTEQDIEQYLRSTTWQTLFHFRIRNKELYVRCNADGVFPPFLEYTAAFMLILENPYCQIEDGDFLIDFADTVAKQKARIPILCFCKDPESNLIMIPDGWSIWKERIELMKEIDAASQEFPWERKLDKGFWMGAPNGYLLSLPDRWKSDQRASLVLFSLENPDLLFARFAPYTDEARFCPEFKKRRKELAARRTTQPDSCKYKYQIDVEGWGCGFHRTQWVLRSNCVNVKQKGPNIQWHYNGLKPYVHYVPYETDCSDLADVINWLRAHDDEARRIAEQGRQYALDYLNTDMIYLYLYQVLTELNKLNQK